VSEATCALCGENVSVEELLLHLRVEHDMDVEPATWPDGRYVVIDTTLEPDDFAGGAAKETT
jgi:hypothetical protein